MCGLKEGQIKIMRIVNISDITQNIKEMCIEANHFLAEDMDRALLDAVEE